MRYPILVLLACCLIGQRATADDYSVVPEPFLYCTTCHGVEFRGNAAVDAPRLNGMERWYIQSQMRAFKEGLRGTHPDDPSGMEMQPQAAALSEQEINEVASFVASVKARASAITNTVGGDVSRGERLYATCAACHGNAGEGSRVLNAPRLGGQSDWYLVRQLENYLGGVRGYVAADTAGQQMRAATEMLTGERDIVDVVAFINTLRND